MIMLHLEGDWVKSSNILFVSLICSFVLTPILTRRDFQ